MKTNVAITSRKAFAETAELRQTEKNRMRQYFIFRGSNFECCRTELLEPMQFTINHCTRCVYDLIDDGFLEIRGKKTSPTSGKLVETIGMKERGLPSQIRQEAAKFQHIGEITPACINHVKQPK